MKRIFSLFFGAILMMVVLILAAFSSMRLAIHGREVDVPNLANLTDPDAAAAAHRLGLNLSVENRFYSAGVSPNHVLSQSPAPGTLVRRGGQVRVTESLGGQHVSIPDVTGQTERPAGLVLRRLQLELGATAHLPAPGPEGTVLAQSPPANSGGVFGPRVSILVADSEADAPAQAYIMPQIVGMTLSAAALRLSSAGLHVASAQDPAAAAAAAAAAQTSDPNQDPAIPPTIVAPAAPSQSSIISSQSPAPGHRVTRADAIRVTVHAPAAAPSEPVL